MEKNPQCEVWATYQERRLGVKLLDVRTDSLHRDHVDTTIMCYNNNIRVVATCNKDRYCTSIRRYQLTLTVRHKQ